MVVVFLETICSHTRTHSQRRLQNVSVGTIGKRINTVRMECTLRPNEKHTHTQPTHSIDDTEDDEKEE